jgi:hypothetical protein
MRYRKERIHRHLCLHNTAADKTRKSNIETERTYYQLKKQMMTGLNI